MLKAKSMRGIKKALWFMVAVIFLIEAWLWDHMTALIRYLVAAVPLEGAKKWIVAKVEPLSPWPTLLVFVIPVILLEPFKLVAFWLFAKGHILAGLLVFLAAKIVGLGVIAFLFETCKPKLLQLTFFAWAYDKAVLAKDWSTRQVAPALERVRAFKAQVKEIIAPYLPAQGAIRNRILRRISWLRRKIRTSKN